MSLVEAVRTLQIGEYDPALGGDEDKVCEGVHGAANKAAVLARTS